MRKLSRLINTWADHALKDKHTSVEVRREHLATSAVSMAVAYRLPIPSSPVESASSWYVQNLVSLRDDMLYSINETVILDLPAAEKLVRSIWLTRYQLVHEPTAAVSTRLVEWISLDLADDIPPVYQAASGYGQIQSQLSGLLTEYFGGEQRGDTDE